jgi:hypothetical protein
MAQRGYAFRGFSTPVCSIHPGGEKTSGPLLPAASGGGPLRIVRPNQHVQEKEDDTDGNSDVGHVEGRPVMVVPVDVQEVHHVSEPGAVDEIAQRPSQDEAQAERPGPRRGRKWM